MSHQLLNRCVQRRRRILREVTEKRASGTPTAEEVQHFGRDRRGRCALARRVVLEDQFGIVPVGNQIRRSPEKHPLWFSHADLLASTCRATKAPLSCVLYLGLVVNHCPNGS